MMKSFRQIIFTVWLLILFQIAFSQVGVGQWRGHLPYTEGKCVAENSDKIFFATDEAIFSYHKSNGELEKLNKVTALSDIGIGYIAYSESFDVLIIGYHNGNLDFLHKNTITNLSDIKRKNIPAVKTINHILFVDDYAVLSTGFGIVILDMQKQEIKYTYYIGDMGSYLKVYQTEFDGEYLYAATENGVYRGDFYNDNLADYNNWEVITNLPAGDPFYHLTGQQYNTLEYFDNKLIVNRYVPDTNNADRLYIYDNETWSYFPDSLTSSCNYITNNGESLIMNRTYKILFYNKDFEIERDIYQYSVYGTDNPSPQPVHFLPGKDDKYELIIADKNEGLCLQEGTWKHQLITLNGPVSSEGFAVDAEGSKVYTVGGGRNKAWGGRYKHVEINMFKDETWQWLTKDQYDSLESLRDPIVVAINPQNTSQAFVGLWGQGVLELQNNELVKHYTENNSTLTQIPNVGYIRIGGLAFDSNQNLWVVNSGGTDPVHVRTPDGEWTALSYNNQINAPNLGKIIVTANDHKWMILGKGNGLFAFDDNGTPADMSDDRTKKISVTNEYGEIISNDVFDIAEDKDGAIWLGTSKGVVVYYNPESVFDENIAASQVLIPRNDGTDNADILLGAQTVTVVCVDGANKKWFGTQGGGVYKTSADGITQIHSFNEDNSPLFSNNIISMDIVPESGEVFIMTSEGLISYRGEASEPKENFDNVYAFPNPVRPDYTGPITIHGLVAGSIVKITDVAGNLVYETRSEGGQALWEGTDLNGNRVHTGVYLVFSANEDGTKSNVTKILFIN
ncbi:MAG: two-component regulator propeller domain-containing protein [Bacteroidota bacterium]|nr:two-component regulator propeller domain-containing protein [Bacteroidota bacterium]